MIYGSANNKGIRGNFVALPLKYWQYMHVTGSKK